MDWHLLRSACILNNHILCPNRTISKLCIRGLISKLTCLPLVNDVVTSLPQELTELITLMTLKNKNFGERCSLAGSWFVVDWFRRSRDLLFRGTTLYQHSPSLDGRVTIHHSFHPLDTSPEIVTWVRSLFIRGSYSLKPTQELDALNVEMNIGACYEGGRLTMAW